MSLLTFLSNSYCRGQAYYEKQLCQCRRHFEAFSQSDVINLQKKSWAMQRLRAAWHVTHALALCRNGNSDERRRHCHVFGTTQQR